MPETILHFKGGKKRFLLSPNHLLCRFYCLHVGYFTVQKKKEEKMKERVTSKQETALKIVLKTVATSD